MIKYSPQKIERKWQRVWLKSGIYWAKDGSKKKKSYILVEFPYPSGEGLHVGHCRPYIAFDILSRKRRMDGFNTLFPMGWDAFGLPTENYAVKTGIHPRVATRKNTAFFKRQQKSLGLSFDWSREINTTDPGYYKWTQWIFLQLFKNDLAYKAKMPINWCPSCKIGLAAEEVIDGSCERCGAKVIRKEKEQWLLRITKYAERLIQDLDLVDYPEKVKTLQKDWIGRSEGWEVQFPISNSQLPNETKSSEAREEPKAPRASINVFTTRIDTLFGATYLVLAPEHPFIENSKSLPAQAGEIRNSKFVQKYIEEAKGKTERERISEVKEKTGVELKGLVALNPANGRKIPIYIADYVLVHYGKGAIMAVPAHDSRDWDFAKKYNLPIIDVIKQQQDTSNKIQDTKAFAEAPPPLTPRLSASAYEGEGILINSDRFTGMKSEDARIRIGDWLQKQGLAKKTVNYKLRDWIFSRQRYWGEPIPLVFCERCALRQGSGQGWVQIPEKDLPLKLPNVKDYKPTQEGESPLAKVKSWVETKCPNCHGSARRETDVMPNWAGSNWYYLAYLMRGIFSFQFPISKYKKVFKYWMPVDWYNGGMEHSTLHLLYSRFIFKFLWDIGAVPKSIGPEPYKKRTSHGVILGEGGIKMSKSKGNVITPDQVVWRQGADTLRVYEMFMGPFGETITWDPKGVKGARRFLEKVWKLFGKYEIRPQPIFNRLGRPALIQGLRRNPKSEMPISSSILDKVGTNPKSQAPISQLERLLHKTVKKVGEDIENLRFNTAISALMVLVNELSKNKEQLTENNLKVFLLLLAPFAPHLSEELWQRMRYKNSVHLQPWPKYDPKLVKEETFTLVIQISGRVRDKVEAPSRISEKEAKELAISSERVRKWIAGKGIKKVVFVPGKLVNIVV
ncbi:MAG: leucyl-tRNA synthetase [Parcubacteria group bacterium Gr01-1014_30]|nr:MAG: leucyl-tRNA synthetase [Parcubacteria group bacterium Gr01-1014_30]